ncbi:PLC-like phosphodiesterase [Phlyctochytrium arcticum]|nr:PLC-like phosphodiesterase [Phlyctochytrium arcticum]
MNFAYTLMSHRGGSLERVENTLPAFRYSAKELKVDLLELDCYLTKDGQVVIFHDKTLLRLCGVPGSIGDYNYQDLPPLLIPPPLQDIQAVVNDKESIRIPLLSDLLKEFPKYPMQIDVKQGPSELVNKVGNMIRQHGRQKATIWGSFREPQNTWCRTRFPEIPHFFTLRRMASSFLLYSVGLLSWMPLRESAMIMPNLKWFMWPGFARAINERGVPIILFGIPGGGINTTEGWEAAKKFGANGICSDRPAALQAWLQNNRLRRVDESLKER